MGYLNRSDVQELWAYQREYQARSVKFGAWWVLALAVCQRAL